jgi:hypothetical protein
MKNALRLAAGTPPAIGKAAEAVREHIAAVPNESPIKCCAMVAAGRGAHRDTGDRQMTRRRR